MKKLMIIFILLCVASACGNNTQPKETDPAQDQPSGHPDEDNDQEEINAPHGVAPAIYYHGKYYWDSGTMIDTGDTILGVESNVDVLPNQEGYGSGYVGSDSIGSSIYMNPYKEDAIILKNENGSLRVFTYYGPLEDED